MLDRALDDGGFDVIMVGCNMLNSSARKSVLPKARSKGVATLLMFAVRKCFADPTLLRDICARLIANGEIDAANVDPDDPFGFLVRDGYARTLTEAAYRYCRHLAGASIVLTGTSQREHLIENIASIEGLALSEESSRMIDALFGHVGSVTGEQ